MLISLHATIARATGASRIPLVAALTALTAALVILVAAAPLTAFASSSARSTTPAPSQPAVLGRVDSLLSAQQLAPAVTLIDSALRAAPVDFDVLWRASRVRLLQGDMAVERSKAQDQFYRSALSLAERAIKANQTVPEGYLRRAAAAGKVALFSGILDAADYVIIARDDATRVLAMTGTPAVVRASAHYILGRTNLKLTETPRPLRMPLGLGFGNLPDALSHLRTATELRPGFVMFELEYARALAQDKRTAEARAMLQRIATLPDQEIGDVARKREAAQLLADM